MMSMIGDPAAVMVPAAVASELARVCTLEMKGHRWSRVNVDTARRMLANQGQGVLGVLAERVARTQVSDPGWAVLTLPDELTDEELQRAAAGVLTALGWPFYSMAWLNVGFLLASLIGAGVAPATAERWAQRTFPEWSAAGKAAVDTFVAALARRRAEQATHCPQPRRAERQQQAFTAHRWLRFRGGS